MLQMKHHKTLATGKITFIGWDDERKVYSEDYYANVGIMNAEDSQPTTMREVRKLRKQFEESPEYANVQYLKTSGKRWHVSLRDDRRDEEVYGEDIDALTDIDAEEIFNLHLTQKNMDGYIDVFPILVEEI